jgi:hypothetical protein
MECEAAHGGGNSPLRKLGRGALHFAVTAR